MSTDGAQNFDADGYTKHIAQSQNIISAMSKINGVCFKTL